MPERYYMGRHTIIILHHGKLKVLIMHLQKGYVGNKNLGYKNIKTFDMDISMVRFCRMNKKIQKEVV